MSKWHVWAVEVVAEREPDCGDTSGGEMGEVLGEGVGGGGVEELVGVEVEGVWG